MLKSVHNNATRFGVDESKLRPFEKLIIELEGQVLANGVIFMVCILTCLNLSSSKCFSLNSYCDLIRRAAKFTKLACWFEDMLAMLQSRCDLGSNKRIPGGS